MFELFISEDILEEIAKRSNQYALTKSGELSGINFLDTNYELYWSNSLDGGMKVCTRNEGQIGDHETC